VRAEARRKSSVAEGMCGDCLKGATKKKILWG
jgi:hypothetical protein